MTRGAAGCRRKLRRIGIEETETAQGYSRAVEVISKVGVVFQGDLLCLGTRQSSYVYYWLWRLSVGTDRRNMTPYFVAKEADPCRRFRKSYGANSTLICKQACV